MNTHKALLVILFMIVFAIFLFTVSNKKRNIIIENMGKGKPGKGRWKTQGRKRGRVRGIKSIKEESSSKLKAQSIHPPAVVQPPLPGKARESVATPMIVKQTYQKSPIPPLKTPPPSSTIKSAFKKQETRATAKMTPSPLTHASLKSGEGQKMGVSMKDPPQCPQPPTENCSNEKKKISNLMADIKSLKENNSSLERIIKEKQSEINTLEKKNISNLDEEKTRLESQYVSKINTLKNNLVKAQEDKNSIKGECSDNIFKLTQRNTELYRENNDLSRIRNDNDDFKTEIEQLESSLKKINENNASLSKSIEEKDNTIYQISRDISKLQREYNASNENNMILTNANKSLKKKLGQAWQIH